MTYQIYHFLFSFTSTSITVLAYFRIMTNIWNIKNWCWDPGERHWKSRKNLKRNSRKVNICFNSDFIIHKKLLPLLYMYNRTLIENGTPMIRPWWFGGGKHAIVNLHKQVDSFGSVSVFIFLSINKVLLLVTFK